jgi:hypothetical protein
MTETATPSEAIRPLNFLVDVSTALTLKPPPKAGSLRVSASRTSQLHSGLTIRFLETGHESGHEPIGYWDVGDGVAPFMGSKVNRAFERSFLLLLSIRW